MSVIKGTKDKKQYQVLKGPSDTRQVRCKRCGNYASQVPDGQGGAIYQCVGGHRFAMRPI